MSPTYDALIIGAGMSGLGAGIRLAHFGKRVCILERHSLWGGLNSFYKKADRLFDVGLHAMTNFAPPPRRGPLSKLCRQLRIGFDELQLRPQFESEVRFPSARLRFSNDMQLLESEVKRQFPDEIDGFRRLSKAVAGYDDGSLNPVPSSAREFIAGFIRSPLLTDLILCPLMFYGSPTEYDLDRHQFNIMFKAVFLEGFCRPEGGVRTILGILKREYLARAGELRLNTGVRRIRSEVGVPTTVELDSGEVLQAGRVFSSAGAVETRRLMGLEVAVPDNTGSMTFVESIFCLNQSAKTLGWDKTILFYSHTDRFQYARSEDLIDTRSGIVCCPENFEGQAPLKEGMIRVTSIANYDKWKAVRDYAKSKENILRAQMDSIHSLGPDFSRNISYTDSFTPLTIQKFTSHDGGAVYGSTRKEYSGQTSSPNVYLCGTDQGYLGIVGAVLSGIIMANRYGLQSG